MKDAWYFFWTWASFFLDLYVSLRTWPDFFVGPGGTKTVGDLPVRFLEPFFFFFFFLVDLHGFLPGPVFFFFF